MSAASKRHLKRVHDVPCVLCGSMPVEAHHAREGQGMAQKGSDWLTAALCGPCHRGPLGVHGSKTMMRIKKLDELDLVAMTLEAIYG